MSIALIGSGAIASYVRTQLNEAGHLIAATVVRPGKESNSHPPAVSSVSNLPDHVDLLIACAGHEALRSHGLIALRSGIDVVTVSIGALADAKVESALSIAAQEGNATLHLACGAIGALDALRAARTGHLKNVTYVGRKPPKGWAGSPAEDALDLENLSEATTHFTGTAREASLAYPKNANVAAAVALSSLGLDNTVVSLIADPNATSNIHEVRAEGEFGELAFTISGNSLPDNPKSSALAAMSVVAGILEDRKPIRF
ncbi:MAG: aspartate dehydrogenase [Boseongicola sp.]|nr:aspartate dehydrogenase [Boseongicola sp.]